MSKKLTLIPLLLTVMAMTVTPASAWEKKQAKPKPPTEVKKYDQRYQDRSTNLSNDVSSINRNSNNAAGGDGGNALAAAKSRSNSDASANSNAVNNLDNTDYVDVITTLDVVGDQNNDQSVTVEGNPVVTFVPNNNTENCLRVIGLSFANSSGGGGIGWPYRSKKCDYEQAADDAFAQGQFKIGWYWKCQNKNLFKSFGSPENCLAEHMNMFVTLPPKPAPSPIDIDVNACCKDKQKCGSDHPEIHKRIFEQCQSK